MERYRHIDIAKGFAILFVFIGHFMFLPSLHLQRLAYTFHMPLFFICAGAFYKPKGFLKALKKDFKRLIIPLLVTFLIWEFLRFQSGQSSFLLHYITRLWLNYQDFTFQQGIDDTIGILWFLPTLFWCKTFFNLLYQIKFKGNWISSKDLRLSSNDLLIITVSLLSAYSSRFLWLPMEMTQGLAVMIFYLGGLKLRQVIVEGIKPKFLPGLILIWAAGFFLAYDPQLGSLSWFSFISFPAAFAGTICVTSLSQCVDNQQYRWGVIAWLGINSMGIYCIHALCYGLVRWMYFKGIYWLPDNGGSHFIFHLSLGITITFLFSKYSLTRTLYQLT